MKKLIPIFFLVLSIFILNSSYFQVFEDQSFGSENDWAEYLGGADRNHFSKLEQINTQNVKNLKVSWEYSTPDSGQMQVNPLIIDGVLYAVDAAVQAFALDASTGKEIWRFGDPLKNWASTSRGVSYWENGEDKRILFTAGANLWELDAKSGKPIKSFGNNGKVDLHTGLPEIAQNKFLISNTPGTIFEDLIIMPLRLSEGEDAAPGDIRAFDIKTGKLTWTFHTIPYPGEFGYETFPAEAYKNEEVGAGNNWAGMAVDKAKGILYVPTGSAAYDFYGGNRKGANLFTNSVLALNARTGKRIWHFQAIHHDIWDRDFPSPPNLVTIKRNGKIIEALAQITKNGYVFVFDRKNGTPIYPIKEFPVPKSKLKGEFSWPTQPLPLLPKPFARQSFELTEKDISIYAENRAELIHKFRGYKRAMFDPPSIEGTVILPGFDGGGEWGGAAVDPQGIMYINSNEMAWIQTMKKVEDASKLNILPLGEKTYKQYCQSCHAPDREGNQQSGYPTLLNIGKKYEHKALLAFINSGKGMMPGFGFIGADEKQALIQYLNDEEKKEVGTQNTNLKGTKILYKMTGYNKFLDSKGLPAISPPWGTLNAIDLNTGQYKWKIVLGDEPKLKAKGIKGTGSENYGGPVVTAGNVLFIAATKDKMFRAFDKTNGKLLWETELPAASFATPATYKVGNKQYIVLACGGTKLGTEKGNKFVAFALP